MGDALAALQLKFEQARFGLDCSNVFCGVHPMADSIPWAPSPPTPIHLQQLPQELGTQLGDEFPERACLLRQ